MAPRRRAHPIFFIVSAFNGLLLRTWQHGRGGAGCGAYGGATVAPRTCLDRQATPGGARSSARACTCAGHREPHEASGRSSQQTYEYYTHTSSNQKKSSVNLARGKRTRRGLLPWPARLVHAVRRAVRPRPLCGGVRCLCVCVCVCVRASDADRPPYAAARSIGIKVSGFGPA